LVRKRIDEHDKHLNDAIPMGRDELYRLATGEPSKESEAFQDDLLRSVNEMKRGRAERKTMAS
jgi:hypothetical protein